MTIKSKFRKGVIGIFISQEGTILLGERANDAGMWQLPQGGIEDGEDIHQALIREMLEEVGIESIKTLKKTNNFISYEWSLDTFPNSEYKGQEHIYFLLDGTNINLDSLVPTEEFSKFKWFSIQDALDHIIDIKKDPYRKAFQELGILHKI